MEQVVINISTNSEEFKKEKLLAKYYFKSHYNLYSAEKFKGISNDEKKDIFDLLGDLKSFNTLISNKILEKKPKLKYENENFDLESLIYSLNCSLVVRNFFDKNNDLLEAENRFKINSFEDFIQNYLLFSKYFDNEKSRNNKETNAYKKSLEFFYTASKKISLDNLENYSRDFILKLDNKFVSIDYSSLDLSSKGIEKTFSASNYCGEDIVGNKELVDKIKLGIRYLLFYNPIKKKNELNDFMKFFSTLFVYGPPGCGKTLAIRNSINELDYLAKKFNKAYSLIELNNSFKSGIFNESIKNLEQVDKQIKKGDKSYLIIADDIDTIFFPRTPSNNSTEEKKIFGEILKMLEGVQKNDYGNTFFIATTNSPDSIDPALLQRLNKNSVYASGPSTPEEYSKIFQNKLRNGIEKNYIKIENWEDIGKISYNLNIGGRGIENICSRLGSKIINPEKIDKIFDLYQNSLKKDKKEGENLNSIFLSQIEKIDDKILLNEIFEYSNEIQKQENEFISGGKKNNETTF